MEEAKNWFAQAEADLRTANNSLLSKDYYASVFWSQQAIEKALKALLLKREGKIIKIHDLVILGRKAKLTKDFLEGCEKLSRFYTESRYSILINEIPYKKFKEKDAKDSVEIASNILRWLKQRI